MNTQMMKYVVFEQDTYKQAILIPGNTGIQHRDISVYNNMGGESKPISAGFCLLTAEGVICYGESVSLNLKSSKEQDERIITSQFCDIEEI